MPTQKKKLASKPSNPKNTAKKTGAKKTKGKATKSPKMTKPVGKHLVVTNSKEAAELKQAIKNGPIIVLFHAEWCGHCKTFMPEWRKLIAVLKNRPDIRCQTAEIESANLGLFPEAGIQGFPTIRIYDDIREEPQPSGLQSFFGLGNESHKTKGQGVDYSGDRTSDALLTYLAKHTQSGGAKAKKHKSSNVFETLVKKGLNPKSLTPMFKKEYKKLEKASKHARSTLNEVRKSLGFKSK